MNSCSRLKMKYVHTLIPREIFWIQHRNLFKSIEFEDYALSWIIFVGKYIHSANLKHSENKASRAQFLLADFETDNYFYSLFLVFANFGCFTISFTSQVVLKHLNEFGASIIVDFKRRINWKSGMSKTAASVAVVEASNSVAVSKKYTKRRGEWQSRRADGNWEQCWNLEQRAEGPSRP